MKIATAQYKTSKHWKTQDITWEQMLTRLRTPKRTDETMQEYRAMSKEEQGLAKSAAGGFVGGALSSGQRKTENVISRSLLTLDADDAYPEQWEEVTMLWDFRMACYPTHSSTRSKPRLRWVVPTDRDMTPEEYPAVARRVAEWIGIDTMDASTYEVARLMYFPTIPKDAPYDYHEQDGPVLCVDEVLRTYGADDAWKDASLWPVAENEATVRLRAQKTAGEPTEKPGIVGLFCRTYDIYSAIDTFLSDVYTPTADPNRYTYAGGSTAGGAVVYQDGAFLYSNHATDPASGQSLNAFDLVRIHLFGEQDADAAEGTAVTKLPSYAAMSQMARDLPEVKQQLSVEQNEDFRATYADLLSGSDSAATPTETAAEAGSQEDADWLNNLTRDSKTGKIEETRENAQLLIRNLPDFKGKLGYNPMRDSITVGGDLPWRKKRKEANRTERVGLDALFDARTEAKNAPDWNENDWPDFYAYMERFGFYTGRQRSNGMLDHALLSVALEREYHPIKSYLEDLVWDGTERLDTLFIRWLGAEDTPLNREITKLWMIAAVDRIVRPGCQFDNVLITVGPQGIGKSRLLRLLSRGFYTNSLPSLNVGKVSGELLQDAWVVEIGELDALRKSELTSAKNFLTSTADSYRDAYARSSKAHPRHCVFAGTSNKGSFLRDETGERRYWVMRVKGTGDRGKLQGFEQEIDQLWAEAVSAWKDRALAYREPDQSLSEVNLRLYLNNEMNDQMAALQENFKLPDEDRLDILGYLDTLRPENWYDLPKHERRNFAQGNWLGDKRTCTLRIDSVSIKELAYELYGEERGSKSMRIGDVLDSASGWRKGPDKRVKGYADYPMPSWRRVSEQPNVREQ